ncbi:hypothetical protein [Polyangium sp. 6x1]|uniref:hypothetical protein n=1 Tax=Polyangium sp. 6x1 TaxID=3042689 RepID=UPI002482ECF3|nr:hypothetical protein [Polyangium sp. 6x1]MDI1447696.1 hypothetical protein [Polyangium sp. 6x1]
MARPSAFEIVAVISCVVGMVWAVRGRTGYDGFDRGWIASPGDTDAGTGERGGPSEIRDITLVVFFLSVQSSYAENTEVPATADVFDTVQFVESETGCWRIKTFAADQDVHPWHLGNTSDCVALAHANTEKHYGDVLEKGYVLRTGEGIEGLRRELAERGLSTHLEVSPSGLVFCTPEGTRYRSKTTPEP